MERHLRGCRFCLRHGQLRGTTLPGTGTASGKRRMYARQQNARRGRAFGANLGWRGCQATVEARSAAMRSSSGGWLRNSFLAAEPAIPNAAICVGSVLWP